MDLFMYNNQEEYTIKIWRSTLKIVMRGNFFSFTLFYFVLINSFEPLYFILHLLYFRKDYRLENKALDFISDHFITYLKQTILLA